MMTDRIDIDYASVKAPFDGQAGITDVNVGDVVTANQSNLIGLASLDPIDVQVALSTSDLQAVRDAIAAGREPAFQIMGSDGKPTGRVATIREFDDSANPRTARLLVRARMDNPRHDIAPGDFLRVRVQVGEHKRLLVPTTALSSDLDQQVVYKVDHGHVTAVPVSTGETFGGRTAILSGLSAGAQIATDNIERLHSGQAVTIESVDADATSAGTDSPAGSAADDQDGSSG